MKRRIIIVSNRLPIVVTQAADGSFTLESGAGGLVSAMAPVLRGRGGLWIGWSGNESGEEPENLSELIEDSSRDWGYDLHPVRLTADEVKRYYYGFANEIIWPIFHDLQTLCNFDPEYWRVYEQVNHKFARAVLERQEEEDYIWVHDYHLMCLGQELRRLGVKARTGFYLHIPFPPLDIFLKLPWRLDMLRALLQYDLIGFQTVRDRRNFVNCVRHIVPSAEITEENEQIISIETDQHHVRVGYFPIGIDFGEAARKASAPTTSLQADTIRRKFADQKIVLGVDRLDYTKGIPYRLEAFGNLLRRYPHLQGKAILVQIVAPSRRNIPEYGELLAEIEQLVGRINGQFTQPGWAPIHYIFRSVGRSELAGYYAAADVALITPLKDGMNLVAKEYCASKEDGVLVLSEFAGAADQLQSGALLVNPYDIELVADTINEAVVMSVEERGRRMRQMRETIEREDIFWWVDSFMDAAFSRRLKHFPVREEYRPQLQI